MNKDRDLPGIRPLRATDLSSLVETYNASFSRSTKNIRELASCLLGAKWPESQVRVITIGSEPVGYAKAMCVPGLDQHYELRGCINPRFRHQGLGSSLLASVMKELQDSGVKKITYVVNTEPDPGSAFLLKRGFSIEHQEWIMELVDFSILSEKAALPGNFSLSSYPVSEAISIFRELYEQTFKELPWYQPYESEEQVAEELVDPEDILFLRHFQEDVGFCWLRQRNREIGEIEPIGLVKRLRRKGLGKGLLREGVLRLQLRGVSRVQIGVWRDNVAGIKLYREVGFRRVQTITHLGIELLSNINMSY
jgi:ribosomal protein S18 acetylase RimI-like enzyme